MKEHGIQHQTTVPYNPEQNGTAERMNRTLLESARSMMYHANIPKEFWAEAVSTATQNRSPTKSLNNTTPFECLFNRKPDVSNLRVFGCMAYTHIPDHQQKKLEEKTRKCIFVGYPDGTKGFKLYDLTKEAFIRSRDVIFEERTFHDHEFKRQRSSEQNFKFFYPPKENCPANPLINQDEIQADDKNVNVEDNNPQPILENNVPRPEYGYNRVGATYEDNFTREVENLNAQRERRPPQRFDEELYNCTEDLTADINEPCNINEAWNGRNSAEWKKATESEYESLIDNHTWNLVPPPDDKNIIGSKWVFKVKRKADETVQKFKARLVAQGYIQSPGIDYDEVFAPVVRYTSIRTLLAVANICNWEIHQMDVKTTFLQGNLNEEIYMRQPNGFVPEKPDYVCKLNKGIYGSKQAVRCWNNSINSYLLSHGYKKSTADPCVYIKTVTSQGGTVNFVMIAIYVDDMLFFSNNTDMLEKENNAIAKEFQVEDLGEVSHILGMLIKRDRNSRTLTISQSKYLEGVLKRFNMTECKSVSTPIEPGNSSTSYPRMKLQQTSRNIRKSLVV